jgi:alanyl-tRNA synthetase
VTGKPAYDEIQARSAVVDELTGRFQCRIEELPARVDSLQEQIKKLQDAVEEGRGRGRC